MSKGGISFLGWSIEKVLKEVDNGHFAIPRLQREFVWNGPKAAKLIDSILREMPVGTILIWETPKSHRLQLRQRFHILPPFKSHNPNVWFLIDGQQRISVLHHVRLGDTHPNSRRQEIEFSKVVFSLNKESDGQQIRYRRPLEGQYISLSTILHPHWRQKLNGLSKAKITRIQQCREKVLHYKMYLMLMGGGLDEIRETFLRINTQGMKVTTADAVFTQAESLDLRDIVHSLREQLDEKFADMTDESLLFLLAAVRGVTDARGQTISATMGRLTKDALRQPKLRQELAKEWGELGPCVAKAVNYLRDRFCVISREFLATDYLVSMLAYFFYKNRHHPSTTQSDEIRKWFWATCVGSRYSGRDFNRCVPEDLKFFKELAEKPSKHFKYTPQVELSDLRKSQYGSGAALTSAVYCMLLGRDPVRLFGKGLNEIPRDQYAGRANRKDRHHIFPRQPLANAEIHASQYNSIANICLLVAEENQQIGARRPSAYFDELDKVGWSFQRKMRRHLIPVGQESGVWDKNLKRGFKRFLDQRTLLISKALEEKAGIRLFRM